MRIALVVEAGRLQVAFEPESDHDKCVCASLRAADGRTVEVKTGAFYHTRGGWTTLDERGGSEATMLVVDLVERA